MAGTDKRKQSLYFPDDMLEEIMKEAIRLDRSLSWVVQRAWRIAAKEVGKFPSLNPSAAAPAAPSSVANSTPGTEARPGTASEQQPGSQVREFLRGKFENS